MLRNFLKSRHSFTSVLVAVMLCGVFIWNSVLPAFAFSVADYDAGSNSESFEDGVEVSNRNSTQGKEISLLAQLGSDVEYTVRYDPNPEYVNKTDTDVFSLTGKTLPMLDSKHVFGTWKQLNKNDYGILGYEFVGWNSRPDGKGTILDFASEVRVNFYVENSDGDAELLSSTVYKAGEIIKVPSDPLHWSVDVSTKEDSNHFTYTFEKWENISDTSGLDIDHSTGEIIATANVNYLAKFQKDTVSWFIKGDTSTLKASTGVAANDEWVQARYNEAVANSNVPTGQLVLYPTNAGLQSAKGLSLIGTLDSQTAVGSAPWYSKASSIKSVYVRPGVRANTSSKGLFADLTLATAFDLRNLNTALITNFNSMFLNAESAKTINVTGFNTSAGTDFANMFDDCYLVTQIPGIESFDMSKATTVELMFSECKKLASLDLSQWNTGKVKNFRGTFSGMHSLKFNDSIGNLNTASATNMSMMFQYCLQFVDIAFGSRFVTNNVTDMSGMFNYCEKLVEIDMSYFNTRKVNNFNKVAANNTTPIFDSCPSLAVVHVGANFGFKGDGSTTVSGGLNGYLPNPQDAHYPEISSTSQGYWFADSDGDKFMYNNIPNYVTGGETYRIYKSYAALYKNNADATDLTLVLGRTAADTAPDTYNGAQRYLTTWNIETVEYATADAAGWSGYRGKVTEVVVKDIIKPKSMAYWFYNFSNCTSYDLERLDTSDCVAFNHLFYGNGSATGIDVSMFDTGSGTLFQGMFYNCSKVTELDLSSFDMRKATNTNNMFAGMNKLQAVHFGANWKWVGIGGFLPNQNGKISGADGKWYTPGGASYAPASVPAGIGSYYATSNLAATAILSYDDGAFDVLSGINTLSLETSVEPAATSPVNDVTLTSVDGSLVDRNEILLFQDEESVVNLTYADGAVLTLYAIWKPIEYTIHYNPNGDNVTGTMPNSSLVYDAPFNLPAVGFERDGYEFSGWATEPGGEVVYMDKEEILNLTDTSGDTIELYAVWEQIIYTITYTIIYDGNGSTGGSMSPNTHTHGISYTLSPNNFVRTGYDFVGWNTKADGSGVSYADKASVMNLSETDGATVVLYAQWADRTVNVTLDPNGGTVTPDNIDFNLGEKYEGLPVPTRPGYKFDGWYTSVTGGSKITADTVVTNADDHTLYAHWIPNTYTVVFDGNGSTGGSMPSCTFTYGVTSNLPSNAYTKAGFIFAGWNTKADGSGTSYHDKALVKNLSAIDGDTVILYAQWKYKSVASYLRFIKDRYFDTLLPNSKWRSEPLQSILLNALNNDLKDTTSCVQVWEFSADDFEDLQKWCNEREKGTQTNKDFIRDFYEDHCTVDNLD